MNRSLSPGCFTFSHHFALPEKEKLERHVKDLLKPSLHYMKSVQSY